MNLSELIKAVQSNKEITFVDAKEHWKELAQLLENVFPDLRWCGDCKPTEYTPEICSNVVKGNKGLYARDYIEKGEHTIRATEAIKMLSINPDVTQEELRTMTEIMTPYGMKKIGRVGNGIVHEETGWYIRIIHEILANGDVIAVCGGQVNKYLSGVKTALTYWKYHTLNAPKSKAQKELEELEKKHKEMGEAIDKLRKEVVK